MDEDEKRKRLEISMAYMTIPFALGVPPLVGWYIGSLLDKLFGTAPYLMYILLVLGFIAGVREVVRIIKKYRNEGV